jgi:hypothetical protein
MWQVCIVLWYSSKLCKMFCLYCAPAMLRCTVQAFSCPKWLRCSQRTENCYGCDFLWERLMYCPDWVWLWFRAVGAHDNEHICILQWNSYRREGSHLFIGLHVVLGCKVRMLIASLERKYICDFFMNTLFLQNFEYTVHYFV